jgi:Na+-translocating ferredoxin:NAD+ oxidoreductase RnfD subunit
MSAPAAPVPGGPSLTIRGRPYPVLLPKLSDPRLHLALVITSLQVLGQVAFDFRLSIAQILLAIGTCAVLEVGIALRRQHVLMWPASAMLTGNGVAFILRVPGTEHGDWWSLNGWWIFVGTAAVSLLSKYVIKWRGGHVFNPSNFGLVLCFLLLGRDQAEPLDFWWGPMSPWLALATAIIVAGGLAILSRLRLLVVAVAFWLAFAAGVAVLALSGHAIMARWHLGPVEGSYLWRILLTSPEILVFLFFMITDPKTTPSGRRARAVYGAGIGLLAALLIAPVVTEYATKVGVLASLAVVCAVRPFLPWLLARLDRPARSRLVPIGAAAAAAYVLALVAAGGPPQTAAAAASDQGGTGLPAIEILPSRGVDARLDLTNARAIARGLGTGLKWNAPPAGGMRVWLERGEGQDPPVAVARLASNRTYELHLDGSRWVLGRTAAEETGPAPAPARSLPGFALTEVAAQVGLRFRHAAFSGGVTNDAQAMMGGGLCWLDYDDDGWLDLFVVNSYADSDLSAEDALPRSALFRNDHGRFVDVTARSGAGVRVKGEGCVAADLDGDGHTDLYVTTAVDDVLLWNDGDGTFTDDARRSGVVSFGWHSGASVADVNGDGRQDLFVAGYTDVHNALPTSMAGFPADHVGVRDLLFLNQGHRRFREVGRQVGLDRSPYDHSLGAVFRDFDGDGRLDLYVANDLDPNRLYLNEPGGPIGFRLVDAARAEGLADPNAGMGVAAADYTGDGRADLFVSNSRGQTHAAYASRGPGGSLVNARGAFAAALGRNLTGWGDSWVDLDNDTRLDLVLANGAIPITNLEKDAGPIQVLAQQADGGFVRADAASGLRVNGRGVAAADYDNDGDVDLAVGSIGGPLALLRNTGARGHWLGVTVRPFSPGATVSLTLADGRELVREVQAGSSYLSSEDPRLRFGLGAAESIRAVTVRYPDGATKRVLRPRVDRTLTIRR